MAGLSLYMGGLGGGADQGAASLPAAAQQPTGPTTIGAKAFGISAGGATLGLGGTALLSSGVLCLAGLIWIWWSLPR
jgi:hypothetical protein